MDHASGAEQATIDDFLERHFGIGYTPGEITPEEGTLIQGVMEFVASKFERSRYPLGLAIDMALLSQQLSLHDIEAKLFREQLTKGAVFERYKLVTARGDTDANTLTLTYHDGAATHSVGIRKLEEEVVDLFVALKRPGYPSAYVYNTGQWQKYQDTLLLPAFKLSEAGRFRLCEKLIDYGLFQLTKSRPIGREKARVRLFEEIVRDYPRSRQKGERAGCVLQGISAGYMKADRPHLYLIVDKTRTGSAKQSRIGDIDGYIGLDLEVTVEVKDMALTGVNTLSEVGEFLLKVVENRVMGVVIVASADDEAIDIVRSHTAVTLTLADILDAVSRWDWRKQEAAVQGLLHFLAHVEQNPDAVSRLLAFIRDADPSHESLLHLE